MALFCVGMERVRRELGQKFQLAVYFSEKRPKIYEKGGEGVTKAALLALRDARLEEGGPGELIDLREVAVDTAQPLFRRFGDYAAAVGNPYLFRVGDVAVKLRFADRGRPFADALAEALAGT